MTYRRGEHVQLGACDLASRILVTRRIQYLWLPWFCTVRGPKKRLVDIVHLLTTDLNSLHRVPPKPVHSVPSRSRLRHLTRSPHLA